MPSTSAEKRKLDRDISVSSPSKRIVSYDAVYRFPLSASDHTYSVLCLSAADTRSESYMKWFTVFNRHIQSLASAVSECDSRGRAVAAVGMDCEWCPPWFRDNQAERVCTIQLYCPHSEGLILSTVGVDKLPVEVENILSDSRILKVGVNVGGDGARIARDFQCPVNGLVDVSKGMKGSLEDLVRKYCPSSFRVSKDTIENSVRKGNWSVWPLSQHQVQYASMDAVLSYAIFLYQHKGMWEKRQEMDISSCEVVAESAEAAHRTEALQTASSTSGAHSNFFLMHRNRSIIPPNLNAKEHPEGTSTCLSNVIVVISGVLDSMSRDDMTTYIRKHGGKVGTSITKSTTHLLNDHGVIGPAKLKKCKAQGIPIIREDDLFEIVKFNSRQQ